MKSPNAEGELKWEESQFARKRRGGDNLAAYAGPPLLLGPTSIGHGPMPGNYEILWCDASEETDDGTGIVAVCQCVVWVMDANLMMSPQLDRLDEFITDAYSTLMMHGSEDANDRVWLGKGEWVTLHKPKLTTGSSFMHLLLPLFFPEWSKLFPCTPAAPAHSLLSPLSIASLRATSYISNLLKVS